MRAIITNSDSFPGLVHRWISGIQKPSNPESRAINHSPLPLKLKELCGGGERECGMMVLPCVVSFIRSRMVEVSDAAEMKAGAMASPSLIHNSYRTARWKAF